MQDRGQIIPENRRIIPENRRTIPENRKAKGMLIYTMQHPLST
jgi:hypothetical protein